MNNKLTKTKYSRFFIILYSNLQQPYYKHFKTLKISKSNDIFDFYKNFSYILTLKIEII